MNHLTAGDDLVHQWEAISKYPIYIADVIIRVYFLSQLNELVKPKGIIIEKLYNDDLLYLHVTTREYASMTVTGLG